MEPPKTTPALSTEERKSLVDKLRKAGWNDDEDPLEELSDEALRVFSEIEDEVAQRDPYGMDSDEVTEFLKVSNELGPQTAATRLPGPGR